MLKSKTYLDKFIDHTIVINVNQSGRDFQLRHDRVVGNKFESVQIEKRFFGRKFDDDASGISWSFA